jgi:hypothetical protein
MKQGKTIQELAAELDRQNGSKRDYVAPSGKMKFSAISVDNKPHTYLMLDKLGEYENTELADDQISARLEIPKKYYDKMRNEAPNLLASNVNTWLQRGDEKYMVRTLDNKVRALLSSRYRPLDNYDLAQAVLPELTKMKVEIVSSEITEKHLYFKATTARMTAEVQKGDVVQAGIVISNSEVGCGSVKIEPMIYRLICLNGMISNDNSLRKYHVGRRGDIDELSEYFKDETRKTDDKAFWMKVRDIVQSALSADIFTNGVEKMRKAIGNKIEAKPADTIKVIENVDKVYGLQNGESLDILSWLMKGGDLNQFGLVNAITRTSQDVKDYERATELERMGGAILELQGRSWESLARIAA